MPLLSHERKHMWDWSKFIGFDFETSGTEPEYALQPWRVAQGKAWVTSFVWIHLTPEGFVDKGGVDLPRHKLVAEMRAMLEYAIENKLTIVGWNTAFDIAWLLAYGLEDLVFKVKWLDGMLLWRHVFIEPEYEMTGPNKFSYGLKSYVATYIPEEAGYEEEIDFHDPDPEKRAKLHAYNVKDVDFTLRGAAHFYKKLSKEPRRLRAALIEADMLPMVARANLNGMVVDTLAARELKAYLEDTADQMLTKLQPLGVTEAIIRSPKQLAKLMYDDWELPVLKENTSKKTGNTSRSTDKEVLHELAFDHPRARDLKIYREALNNCTKFADAPLTSAEYNGDWRSHPNAIIFGTYSGRLTYSSSQGKNKGKRQTGFALHQEKRDKIFRSIIAAPEGYTLMEFDAAGQEFRWMAIASGDETMLKLCAPGEDAHTYMAAQINEEDYRELQALVKAERADAKERRQLGKIANLSLQYRTSPPKLRTVARVQYNLPMELPEAQRIHKTYQRTYIGVPRYWHNQITLTKERGWVETLAGRRVQVKGDWSGRMGWSMGSTSINYRIQGTGADQKYLALSVIKPYLTKIGAYFAWDLHDGIYLYVPNDKVRQAAHDIRHLLINLPYKKAWDFTPPIELPWDCKVGPSWGALKDFKFD